MIGMAFICGGAIIVIEVIFIVFGGGFWDNCGEGLRVVFVLEGICAGGVVEIVLVVAVDVVLRVALVCFIILLYSERVCASMGTSHSAPDGGSCCLR